MVADPRYLRPLLAYNQVGTELLYKVQNPYMIIQHQIEVKVGTLCNFSNVILIFPWRLGNRLSQRCIFLLVCILMRFMYKSVDYGIDCALHFACCIFQLYISQLSSCRSGYLLYFFNIFDKCQTVVTFTITILLPLIYEQPGETK